MRRFWARVIFAVLILSIPSMLVDALGLPIVPLVRLAALVKWFEHVFEITPAAAMDFVLVLVVTLFGMLTFLIDDGITKVRDAVAYVLGRPPGPPSMGAPAWMPAALLFLFPLVAFGLSLLMTAAYDEQSKFRAPPGMPEPRDTPHPGTVVAGSGG